jgi:hypothetical protein
MINEGNTILVAHLEYRHACRVQEILDTVLDGAMRYSVTIRTFLDLWNKLDSIANIGRIPLSRLPCVGGAVGQMP